MTMDDTPISISPTTPIPRRRSIVSIQTEKGKVTPLSPYTILPKPKESTDVETVIALEHQLDIISHHDDSIKSKLQYAFLRSCMAGDMAKVMYLLNYCTNDIDINGKDDSGHTGLMLASTFGHLDVVQCLTHKGADLNIQDGSGWTALLWATNNNNSDIVEFLLEQGVDEQIQSKLGRTVKDYVDHAHLQTRDRLSSIFYSDTRSVYRSPESVYSDGAETTLTSLTSDSYYVPSLYGVDYRVMCDIVGTTVPAQLQHVTLGDNVDRPPDPVDVTVFLDEEDEGLVDFCWDKCPPSQMFVFSDESLQRLLDIAIKRLSNPKVIRSHNNNPAGYTRRPVSANILFLATRYAGYYASQDLVDQLLGGAFTQLELILPPKRHDMMFLGYWLANTSRLLYFLKKDNGLVVPTLHHQVQLTELVQDIFMALVRDAQSRIRALIDEALLDHDPISNGEMDMVPKYQVDKFVPASPTTPVDHKGYLMSSIRRALNASGVVATPPTNYLSGDISPPPGPSLPQHLNRLSNYFTNSPKANSTSAPQQPSRSNSARTSTAKPRTITTILSTTVYVLQTFQIHASLIHQAVEQLFFYIGAVCLNRILARPELCCRWKALLIRMNISQLEDWVQANSNSIPAPAKDTFTRHLLPVVSLVQLLQIMTNFPTLEALSEALNESNYLDVIHWSHIRRVMDLYRYEEDETELSPEISQYIVRCATQAFANETQLKYWVRGIVTEDGEATMNKDQDTDLPIDLSMGNSVQERMMSPPSPTIPVSPTVHMVPPSVIDEEQHVKLPNDSEPPPIQPPPIEEIVDPHQGSGGQVKGQQRVRGPMNQKQSRCTAESYPYLVSNELFWLPFAVPSNVGERVILRILEGQESYIEEAPILSEEIVKMLDGIS